MRFKLSAPLIVLLVIVTYVLHLGISQDLDLYIHPRYIVFTLTMASIAGVVLLLHARSGTLDHSHKSKPWTYAPLVLMLGGALFLPARSLSSATVTQRSVDSLATVSSASQSGATQRSLFAGSSKGLSLGDWSRLLRTNTDPSYYANKPVKVSGFVYDAGLGNDTIWLARFVLTCCAVDAQPIGVPVRIEGWQNDFEQDEWLEVEGAFKLSPTSQGEQMVLVPEQTTKISEPENPYATI